MESLYCMTIENKFGVDYEQEHKRICFEWYCGMVRLTALDLYMLP